MQNRMKSNQLNDTQIKNLLDKVETGTLATVDTDGNPYAVPVHFAYVDETIMIHGLPKGQKIDNIKANPNVSFTAYDMNHLILDENGDPCNTNTKYQSVVIFGKASLETDLEKKYEALMEIVKKYTPQLSDRTLPDNMVRGTAVLKIDIRKITGKFYG